MLLAIWFGIGLSGGCGLAAILTSRVLTENPCMTIKHAFYVILQMGLFSGSLTMCLFTLFEAWKHRPLSIGDKVIFVVLLISALFVATYWLGRRIRVEHLIETAEHITRFHAGDS